MKLVWGADALLDLERFGEFLNDRNPALAGAVGQALIVRTALLAEYPELGRPIAGRGDYRQLVVSILSASYVVQYRVDAEAVVILRVFHGREDRDP